MAARIANTIGKGSGGLKGNMPPAPPSQATKIFNASLFGDMDDAKSQLDYINLLVRKSEIRAADVDNLGPDGAILKSLCGTRTPEESMALSIMAKLSKIDERDPRMLSLRSVYGSDLSKLGLARSLASRLIAKRHAEAALYAVLGKTDADFTTDSRTLYNAAMNISETNIADAQILETPNALFGFGDGVEAILVAGAAARAARVPLQNP
jgi:hypothetical protein